MPELDNKQDLYMNQEYNIIDPNIEFVGYDDNTNKLSFSEKNRLRNERNRKFHKEGPGKIWRIIYCILIIIVFFAYFGYIHLNIYLLELILAFLIIGTVIHGLLLFTKKNREKIKANKRGRLAVSTILIYIIVPIRLYNIHENLFGTMNGFMRSTTVYLRELEDTGIINNNFFNKNKEEIMLEISKIANEKAGYDFFGEGSTQAPKQKFGNKFWDDVLSEFNPILLEKIEEGERTN